MEAPRSLSSKDLLTFEKDIADNIIQYMSPRSIFSCSTVCKDWWQVIKDHRHRFRCLIRRVQVRKALAYPDFNLLRRSFEAQDRMEVFANILRHFCENLETEQVLFPIKFPILTNENYIRLVYGNVARLRSLWANLPNHNPTFNLGNASFERNLRY